MSDPSNPFCGACGCGPPLSCSVVFDNAFNATTDDTDPASHCPGGPWYLAADHTVLNDLWWTQTEGPAVNVYDSGTCWGDVPSRVRIIHKVGVVTGKVVLKSTTQLQKTSFRATANFTPRQTGDVFGFRINFVDGLNYDEVRFEATDQLPAIGVYRIIAGVETKLYRRENASGTIAGEGFYFDLPTVPCPKLTIDISLARKVLLVRVTGDGTQPDGAGTTYSALNYNWDWSTLHPNPEYNGVTGPTSATGTSSVAGPDIGLRQLEISADKWTAPSLLSGGYTMVSGNWAIIGEAAGPTDGNYLEVGNVKAIDTTLDPTQTGIDCGGATLDCAPLFTCYGLLTMKPLQITATGGGNDFDCGPKARVWDDCIGGTSYTDCHGALGAPWELVSEELCSNWLRNYTADWTPTGMSFDGVTGVQCDYYTGHTNTIDDNNPAYSHEYVHCGVGVDQDKVVGHEGFVSLGYLLSELAAGFGVGIAPPYHQLNRDQSGGSPIDYPFFWVPSDVIGLLMRNQFSGGSEDDCLWSKQEMTLFEFIYDASD